MMDSFLFCHVYCFVITFYREIYEAKLNLFGQIMRALEVLGLVLYLQSILLAIKFYTTWLILDLKIEQIISMLEKSGDGHEANAVNSLDYLTPEGFSDLSKFKNWRGRALEWFFIEIIICIFFTFTMVLLMGKSRILRVGIDNSYQYEPLYVSKLANKLVQAINFDLDEVHKSKERTKRYYTKKQRSLRVEGVLIKVKLTPEDFDDAYLKAYYGETENFVEPEKATAWVTRNVVG